MKNLPRCLLVTFATLAGSSCTTRSSSATASPTQTPPTAACLEPAPSVMPAVDADASPATPRPPSREVVVAPKSPQSPLSPAVRAGTIVFVSGQLGTTPGTRDLVPGGVEPETRAALENTRLVLEGAGLNLQDVAKCTVFLANIQDFEAMNRAYSQVFASQPPARSTVAVAGLVFGAKVEIECMAAAR